MGFYTTIRSGLMLGLALTLFSGNAWAQDDWPTVGDFYTEGIPVPPGELERLLAEKPAVIGFESATAPIWAIVKCDGSNTTFIKYDTPMGSVERGECRVTDSTVCILSPGTGAEDCIVVRRIPGFDLLFADISPAEITLTPEQHIAERGDQPAVAGGFAELDLYNLAAASGQIDMGFISIDLPTRYGFALFNAVGFPLVLNFVGQTDIGFMILAVGQVGWPARHAALPPDHSTPPEAMLQASEDLAQWEERFKSQDLGGDGTDAGIELLTYRSTLTSHENGHCLRIIATIFQREGLEGSTHPPTKSAQLLHRCISVSDGAVVTAGIIFPDLPPDLTAGDVESEVGAILDTLQVGTLSGDARAEVVTYDNFLALQGGDPDLSWELLDCVQGWNRAAQINGCNHAITRYNQLIDAGTELIALGALSDDQSVEVRETIDSGERILATLHSLRSGLLRDEAPSQAREDCRQAQMIAARLEDAELIARFAKCMPSPVQ